MEIMLIYICSFNLLVSCAVVSIQFLLVLKIKDFVKAPPPLYKTTTTTFAKETPIEQENMDVIVMNEQYENDLERELKEKNVDL